MSIFILTNIQKTLGQILKKITIFYKFNDFQYKEILDVVCYDD